MIRLMLLFGFYTVVQLAVNQYAATVFAYNDLFALFDLALALGRYGIKTTAASIAENRNYSQAVPVIFADAFVRRE
jgi:hypothetical protein